MNLEYLAGYFDGEGCVSFVKALKQYPSLRISIASADKEILELFSAQFGGAVHKEKSQGRKRQMYRWTKTGEDAQNILRQLAPFLIGKRPQAELALIPDFRKGKVGKRLTEEERQLRLQVMAQVQSINQRITVEAS